MDSKDGGQYSSDLQRQAAAAIARQKVLATYAEAAREAAREAQIQAASSNAHLKDMPIDTKVSSDSWKKYHSAWQNYYQKYYGEYYSRAAKAYIEKERQRQALEKAREERIFNSITQTSAELARKPVMSIGSNNNAAAYGISATGTNGAERGATVDAYLRQEIQNKATDKAKKSRRLHKLMPLLAGLTVTLLILFLQYNRLIFAPLMAYVSPGNAPASQIEAVDPTITQTVSADPRLIIPKINVDVPIHFGVPLADVMSAMNEGVAHYRIAGASAYPGEIGNFVITGHSAGDIYSSNPYKYIFSGLERLENGDLVYVNYNSKRYIYSVVKKEVIEPTNVAALTVPTEKPILTLVTCTPLGTSRYRLLVTADQISPSTEGAKETESLPTVDQNLDDLLPANEPSFFEGVWNWLTGQ